MLDRSLSLTRQSHVSENSIFTIYTLTILRHRPAFILFLKLKLYSYSFVLVTCQVQCPSFPQLWDQC